MSATLQENNIIYISHGATLDYSSLETGHFYLIKSIKRFTDTMYQIIVCSIDKNSETAQILYDTTLKRFVLCDTNDQYMLNVKLITLEVIPKELSMSSCKTMKTNIFHENHIQMI